MHSISPDGSSAPEVFSFHGHDVRVTPKGLHELHLLLGGINTAKGVA